MKAFRFLYAFIQGIYFSNLFYGSIFFSQSLIQILHVFDFVYFHILLKIFSNIEKYKHVRGHCLCLFPLVNAKTHIHRIKISFKESSCSKIANQSLKFMSNYYNPLFLLQQLILIYCPVNMCAYLYTIYLFVTLQETL